jgi:CP12 domain
MAQELKTNAATLEQELPIVIDQARAACSINGDLSSQCAAAWDIVEEIQATIAHRKADQRNSLQRYCDDRPDALECRVYDV